MENPTQTDSNNPKFLLKNGRQIIDYLDEAGTLFGFCIGRAVQCFYKATVAEDEKKKEKLMKDGNWFINQLARRKNIVRDEIVSIVSGILSRIERDRI